MNEVLSFTNFTVDSSYDQEEATIQGEQFQALMDLCFAHADLFSLHRCNWPGANDGALEQALRPFCMGEYRSYAAICISDDKQIWEKCYLYPATDETKAILLRYIPHLFGREPDPAPEGHTEYLEKKYAAYYKACEAAKEQITAYLDTDPDPDMDAFLSFSKKVHCEARTIWQQLFDPKDYYSNMEDPLLLPRGRNVLRDHHPRGRMLCPHILRCVRREAAGAGRVGKPAQSPPPAVLSAQGKKTGLV